MVRECLGNFLGHPVVGEYHALSNGLVNTKVLFGLDAVNNTLGLELKLDFRSGLQPGRERERERERERVKSHKLSVKRCCFWV